MFRFLLIFVFLGPFAASGQDYRLYRPPSVITENLLETINIVTIAEMELGELPKHPKITWLGYSSVRLPTRNAAGKMQTNNQISFIANAPGIIEFPPIPIVLENKEFFIRIGEIQVDKNLAPKDDTRLEVRWNGQPEIPEEVHLGEAVEVHFLEFIEASASRSSYPYFSEPSNRVEGARWHQYVRYQARKPIPSDFFYTYSQSFFGSYGRPENYRQEVEEIDGKIYRKRTYKARLYFTKPGMARGHLSATLGTSRSSRTQRTHVLPFEIKVVPLPPLPNDQAIDTGLIGDWEIEANHHPSRPIPARSFVIRLAISGQGNPNLRNEWDFSAPGFPSVESELYPRVESNYDFWEADFSQTLLPTGKIGTLPEITLASFDTVGDRWRFHEVTPTLTLPGFEDLAESLTPKDSLGSSLTRPVLLNLPPAIFGAFALAPFLPFLFGFARKRLDARDPAQKERERNLRQLINDFQAGRGSPDAIDEKLLPILRHRLQLPQGATVREIAAALEDPELRASLEAHADSSFSSTAKPVDYAALARQLSRLSLLILLAASLIPPIHGANLSEANAAYAEANYREAIAGYQALLEERPNDPALHFNLARAYLSANKPARARASCHTSLLLDPLDQDARDLMDRIRERQGDLTLTRNRFLDLRPDQWIVLAAVVWIIAFLYFGIRKFRPLPRWPGLALVTVALVILGTAAWRQKNDYAPDQYMVLAEELPREPEAGTPDWNYPALRAGQIVQVTETNATHAHVQSSDSGFWLPVNELQQVW